MTCHSITATPPGHNSIHPSTNFSEKALSENDPADDEPITTDPEQAQPPAPIEIDGGYGWICMVCVFLVNAHTLTNIRSGSKTLIFAVSRGTGKGKYVQIPLEAFKKDQSAQGFVLKQKHGSEDLRRIMAMK